MPRSMGDQDYEYRPATEQQRQRQSEAQRARLGIPAGHVRVYGVHVPEDVAETIRPIAAAIASRRGFQAAHDFVADAEAKGWRYDASAVPVKKAAYWTPERRKAASEAAKARHAARRAAEEARWEAEKRSPEYRLRETLARPRRENERRAQIWHQVKAQIGELEEAETHLNAARATLLKHGLIEP